MYLGSCGIFFKGGRRDTKDSLGRLEGLSQKSKDHPESEMYERAILPVPQDFAPYVDRSPKRRDYERVRFSSERKDHMRETLSSKRRDQKRERLSQ